MTEPKKIITVDELLSAMSTWDNPRADEFIQTMQPPVTPPKED